MNKEFKLSAEVIRDLVNGFGACFASDMITVDGNSVGYMYREEPDNEVDSGWRFLSGLESDEYMSNSDNFELFDVNTIANYDPDIIQYLESPIGSSFAKKSVNGELQPIE